VIRPQSDEYHDFRGYAGRIAGGVFRVGDPVVVLPSGFTSRIKSIVEMNKELEEAFPPMSVAITLEDDIDISRGDMIVRDNNLPQVSQDIDVMMCWMNEKPLLLNGKYTLKHTTHDVKCLVKEVLYKVNVNNLEKVEDFSQVGMNDIARVALRTTKPLMFDSYRTNRITGSLILIDEATNETVGAGMII
jgi:sulfate adenylyltransferase subunit 1